MIYLAKKFGKQSQSTEHLLIEDAGFMILYHWTVHDSGEVKANGPLQEKFWPHLAEEIEDNPEWVVCTEAMPLARLIVALKERK